MSESEIDTNVADGSDSSKDVYENDFVPYINKWGRRTNLLAVALSFGPAVALLTVFGILPPTQAVIGAFISVAATYGIFWLVEPLSYYPVLGIPGTYMAFLSGNISNLRLPCAAAAQESADVQTGTPQGSIISTIAIAASIAVNTTLLGVGAFALVSAFQALPALWQNALDSYLVPAVFGAIFAQFGRDYPKVAGVGFTLALAMTTLLELGFLNFLPGYPLYVVIIVSVFGTILIARWMWENGMIHPPDDS
ncbi:hypothetical protein Htur_4153 (plasmid) [Haloterrigena turkmenica DSM 5511]|uniref:Uncharacterized protein n=1 Tax=Haloterrigena turkmenica (strain ATCC 51198 / DSM 5511 / JCM 9101 / NCIMB 13204 / VKM B-1734 / 4k) TaxID=543526 RepID=D2S0S9_HALTV|nr:hypothetical protein [Haloterrigena turkmenica]ADB62976.1 hypothetical protein Htur_4153 [Haloterrigena turkmenica DSM 5511]